MTAEAGQIAKRMSLVRFVEMVSDGPCMKCGAEIEKADLHVHHINMDRTDDRLHNLSILCRKCHYEEHRDKNGGWRRNIQCNSILPAGRNKTKVSWEERAEKRLAVVGGIEGFKALYGDRSISMADIAIKLGVVRERVRQIAARLGLPPRDRGYMSDGKPRKYGFPFRHRPLSDWMQSKGMKTAREGARYFGMSYQPFHAILICVRPVSASRAIDWSALVNGELTAEQLINPNGANTEQTVAVI